MWVWDSTNFIATSDDERGGVWQSRWEPSEDDFQAPLPENASRGEVIGRVLATIILAGFVAYLFWALPI